MPLYTPSKSFVERLAQFDPLLRIRWGDHSLCWLIERKLTKDRWIDPGTATFAIASLNFIPLIGMALRTTV